MSRGRPTWLDEVLKPVPSANDRLIDPSQTAGEKSQNIIRSQRVCDRAWRLSGNCWYVADHLGRRNLRNTRVYAQITNPLRDQVFRELEQHPKIVRVEAIVAAVMPS